MWSRSARIVRSDKRRYSQGEVLVRALDRHPSCVLRDCSSEGRSVRVLDDGVGPMIRETSASRTIFLRSLARPCGGLSACDHLSICVELLLERPRRVPTLGIVSSSAVPRRTSSPSSAIVELQGMRANADAENCGYDVVTYLLLPTSPQNASRGLHPPGVFGRVIVLDLSRMCVGSCGSLIPADSSARNAAGGNLPLSMSSMLLFRVSRMARDSTLRGWKRTRSPYGTAPARIARRMAGRL